MSESNKILKNHLYEFLHFIETYSGIFFSENNYTTIVETIKKRSLEFEIDSVDYLNVLRINQKECEIFLNEITINETYFFREERQFGLIESHVIPELKKDKISKFYFWSAACSYGEEAYSIAMLNQSLMNSFEVFASDVNTRCIEYSKKGSYTRNSFRTDGKSFQYLIDQYTEKTGDEWQVANEIKAKVISKPFNLVTGDFAEIPPKFHVIFLRNLLIYMKPNVKNKVIENVVSHLHPGGFLFLSSPEVPYIRHPHLDVLEKNNCYFFQKKKNPSKITKNIDNNQRVYKRQKANAGSSEKNNQANRVYQQKKFPRIINKTNEVIQCINKGKFECAQNIIDEIKDIEYKEIIHYFNGLILMHKNQVHPALEEFEKSIDHNRNFWLSHFYIGLLGKEENRGKSILHFQKCLNVIKDAKKNSDFEYEALFENFNEKYFEDMADKWIKKLSNK